MRAYRAFLDAGHSYAPEFPADQLMGSLLRGGELAWKRAHLNWLERWAHGWYGMSLRDHRSMLRNNYIGHRNMQTYVDGPKFYIPPRRGPWLWFLRWLQVVPPRPLTLGDQVDILQEKPFAERRP